MKRLVIQYIVGARPAGVDESELPWQTINGEDYAPHEWERAWSMAETYDSDFEHRFTHRVVEADVAPPAPRPPVKAKSTPPPAPKAAPKKAAPVEGTPKPAKTRTVNRQLSEHRAQTRFDANCKKLSAGLQQGVPFEYLQPLVDALEADLDHCGSTLLAVRFREQFAALRALVDGAGKTTLRVVK
jgi:hypothetical protein